MKRKIIASIMAAAAFALTATAACSDNNDDDYYLIEEETTEETTTTVKVTTTEATTEAATLSIKDLKKLVSTYSGTYVAEQGVTGLDLSVFSCDEDGVVQALFSFHEDPSNTGVPSGSYLMEGVVTEADKKTIVVDFKGSEWEKKPDIYSIVEFTACFDLKKGTVTSDEYELELEKSAGADISFLINEYKGTYSPDAGEAAISFRVEETGDHGNMQAVFEYEPESGKKAEFISVGQVTNIAPDGSVTVSFKGDEWIIEPKDNKFIDFEGVFSPDGLDFKEEGGHNIELHAE